MQTALRVGVMKMVFPLLRHSAEPPATFQVLQPWKGKQQADVPAL